MDEDARLTVPWFVVRDDIVGGWSVATVDAPTSELETPREWVADCPNAEVAGRVVSCHNAALRAAGS